MLTRTIDIWCDQCQQWKNLGPWSQFPRHRKEARRQGWSRHKNTEGSMVDICPACNGRAPHYWQLWYDGKLTESPKNPRK